MFLDSTPSASFSHVESNEYNDHCDPKDLSQVSWFGQKLLTHLLHMKCNWINWENSRTLGNYTAAGDFSFAAGGQVLGLPYALLRFMFHYVLWCLRMFHDFSCCSWCCTACYCYANQLIKLIKQFQSFSINILLLFLDACGYFRLISHSESKPFGSFGHMGNSVAGPVKGLQAERISAILWGSTNQYLGILGQTWRWLRETEAASVARLLLIVM